jgi:hypothetical protein
MNQSEVQYWINEVNQGLEALQETSARIGRALKKLRGDKYSKARCLWKDDPGKPKHLSTFDEYCKWKWDLSYYHVAEHIRAYETVEDIEEEPLRANVPSPATTEEFVIRPLTRLKKEERQRAWEIANKIAQTEGKKLTNKHTSRAAMIIRNVNEDLEASRKEFKKRGDEQDRAELALVQSENLGIAEARAKAKVTRCLEQLFQDENEKASLYLARMLADRLFEIYPQLMDEPIRSFSLK